jgi:hypothetical protein
VPVAVNCTVPPAVIEGFAGASAIDCRVGVPDAPLVGEPAVVDTGLPHPAQASAISITCTNRSFAREWRLMDGPFISSYVAAC